MGGARWLLPSMVAGATLLVGLVACQSPDSLDAWPAALEVRSPVLQTGLTDYPVNEPPAVRLLDNDGNPIAGARITFAVTGGGGAVTGSVAATGADGVARVGAWSVALGVNTLEASIPAPFRVPPVTFTATGVPAA